MTNTRSVASPVLSACSSHWSTSPLKFNHTPVHHLWTQTLLYVCVYCVRIMSLSFSEEATGIVLVTILRNAICFTYILLHCNSGLGVSAVNYFSGTHLEDDILDRYRYVDIFLHYYNHHITVFPVPKTAACICLVDITKPKHQSCRS